MRNRLFLFFLFPLFAIAQEPQLQVLHNFTGSEGRPMGTLVARPDGNLYGLTSSDGAPDISMLYKMTSDGALTRLVTFNGANGSSPFAGLVSDDNGNFYGTTLYGGRSDLGTVFKVT